MRDYFKELIEDLKSLEEVELIMLGGSKALNKEDALSDYDVYVYYSDYIEVEARREILKKYFKYVEVSNKFFEEEDDGILINGKEVELIYRDLNFLEDNFIDTFEKFESSFGYSTCMVHNILTSKVLYDKNDIIKGYREKYNFYPKELKESIVLNNIKLLDNQMPSLSYQIIKAIKRGDIISINHRITEYLAIYFDILFSLNEEFHPGEKRLLPWIEKFKIKPENSKELITNLLNAQNLSKEDGIKTVKELSNGMNDLVKSIYKDFEKSNYSKEKGE
ncbi:MAG: DUF4037 domain-containing protein [Clostridium chrysemydis]|uniref:DUF4037 domain-containing protein n=1 Tax=Clostridium TaxID=1485 RepID=UPI0021529684|nr:DUF4037 domain-containing protein [Clostridium sp. LY3-2]MCR6515955.1 DUF4037 domain-containing protein [Clostridium sp. LY3-2]